MGVHGLTGPHQYVPDATGTQCSKNHCWGWVDDPRHAWLPPAPAQAIRIPQRWHKEALPGKRWDDFGRCRLPRCAAAPGKPCLTVVGSKVGSIAKSAHRGRPRTTVTAPNPPEVGS